MSAARFVWRLLVVAVAFAAACAAATAIIYAASAIPLAMPGFGMRGGDWSWTLATEIFGMVAAAALIPAAIFIAYAEKNAIRSWVTHGIVGAAIPLPLTLMIFVNDRLPGDALAFALLAPVAGLAGGLAYRLVADNRFVRIGS